jgi:O-antigen/teichoic acid export membrane protein
MVNALTVRLPGNRLFRDVLTTYTGFLVNAGLGFVTLTLMAKHMGPSSFGLATLANLFMALVAGLAEPGIGTALVRLASRPGVTAEVVDELVVAGIRLKLAVTATVCGLSYLLMPWITAQLLHRPEFTPLLRWCLVGAAPLSLAMFAGALFQIRGAFRDNAATLAVAGAVRTIAVVLFWGSGRLTLQTAVGSMILMNGVQWGLCIIALRGMLPALPWRCRNWSQMSELLGYTRYLVIWLLAGTIHPRADTLLLSHFVTDNRVLGFYSAAAQLCLMVPRLTDSINMVLLPRISALRTPGEMLGALRNCGLGALAVFLLLAPVSVAAGPVLHLIFGIDYLPAVPVFRILLIAAVADLALNPLSNFWHALDRPAMLSLLNMARLSLLVLVAVLAIPRLGGVGAGLAVAVSTILPLAAQGAILWMIILGKRAKCGSRGKGPTDSLETGLLPSE